MIGIFGGTFDPVHNAHLRTALDVQQALSLDEIIFIPCGEPAHREQPVASALQRLSMLRAAVIGQNGFSVDDREITRSGPSYMIDTLIDLKKSLIPQLKDQTLCLILGSDAFKYLDKWHRWQELFNYAHIVVMQRPDSESGMETNQNQNTGHVYNDSINTLINQRQVSIENLKGSETGKICFVPVTQLDISSTKIRKQWQLGKDIKSLIPDSVFTLIQQQNIY